MPQTSNPTLNLLDRPGLYRSMPETPAIQDLQKRLATLEDLFRAGISFGVPVSRDSLGTAAGARTAHMRGNFVRVAVTSLNTNIAFAHNLNLQAPTGVVNVSWLVFGWRHNNVGAGAGDTVSVGYIDGAITSDSISLRVFASGARTIDVTNPLTITLWFMPADG